MPTSDQVIEWIDQNTDEPLTDWQAEMIRVIFNPDYSRAIATMPRRNGHTSLRKRIQQALDALPA
jgi:hypothetical protein